MFDRLGQHFDRGNLFMDVDGIEPGVDFVKALDEQVAQCGAFVAVIGQRWTDITDASGERRLNDPHDYVRLEIEAALRRDIRVIPVLVDGARMPRADDLPEPLKPLARRNAFELAHHRFGADADQLAQSLQRALGVTPVAAAPPPQAKEEGAPAEPSWAELLFSFRGRISRKQYWLPVLALLIVGFCLSFALAFILGDAAEKARGQMELSQLFKLIWLIISLPFYWPIYALTLKRMHDFGHGLTLLLPLAALSVLQIWLDITGHDQASVNAMFVIGVGWVLTGCIKGTPGPNEFGPDPLEGKRARSNT